MGSAELLRTDSEPGSVEAVNKNKDIDDPGTECPHYRDISVIK